MLRLYNTLTRKVEEIPKKDHLNLYTCGPTVYDYAHIGNLRSYITADFLYRMLKFEGYNPRWVMNITDIDDKTIKGALSKYGSGANVENLREFTKFYFEEFIKDLRLVNVCVDQVQFIKVTDIIPQIQEFIVELMDKGYAYKADDGVYFNIEKYQQDFGDYGQLVGNKFLGGKRTGVRVAVDEYEKDSPSDFALWKAYNQSSDGQIFWDHKVLGKGRPGWHIECSAVNRLAFNNEPADIHTGGVDLIFPHHTNEIAQSQALLGKGNFVRHWLHSEHILVDGKKMAKRDGGFITLNMLKGEIPLPGPALRYLYTQSSYRTQQNFTMNSLVSAYRSLEKIYNTVKSHKIIGENQELQQGILEDYLKLKNSSQNDLNVPSLMALLFQVLSDRTANIHTQDKIMEDYEHVLGLNLQNPPSVLENIELPVYVRDLLQKRQSAKLAKDFPQADLIRIQIEAAGYEVMDTSEGQRVKKKI